MRSVRTARASTCRRRSGPSAVTAVLCDGIVCDGFIYKYLWEDLARFVSVAHWNYRGHGRSALPADPDRISVEDHGADLDAVRRHIGDPPVVLIGHSFGTQVALEAYRRRPTRRKSDRFSVRQLRANHAHVQKHGVARGTAAIADRLRRAPSAGSPAACGRVFRRERRCGSRG